jgi:hypothetical protein
MVRLWRRGSNLHQSDPTWGGSIWTWSVGAVFVTFDPRVFGVTRPGDRVTV